MRCHWTRVTVVFVGQHDHADFPPQIDKRLRLVSGIRSTMPDIDLVFIATHGKTDRVPSRPVIFHDAHTVHFPQGAGAEDLAPAHTPVTELKRNELRHVLHVRSDSSGRTQSPSIDKR